ncbi:MAG TPA: C40 family peptidase [Pyrinomonadaceae bacterium]|jgi:peptidoglycan endopeptidase LytE
MSFCKLFPRPLAACFALSLLAISAQAQQQTATRPRQATATTTTSENQGRTTLENDIVVVSTADEAEPEYEIPRFGEGPAGLGQTERLMLTAIEQRLGTPYRLGTEGPSRYDCSGFVWSVFQQAGVAFERTSARNFWHEFAPPAEDEKFRFGTLVFFNNLAHVGIVADEHGFYHASTSKGVVYSRFDDYWTKRISGFRRVPAARVGAAFVASAGR